MPCVRPAARPWPGLSKLRLSKLRLPRLRLPRLRLPRLLRTASFRLTVLYVAVFAVSVALLGAAVFLAARSALEQQMAARVETETAYLREEFQAGGLDRLLAVVRSRGRGAIALDYLVQDRQGAHLAGEMPALADAQPGWTTIGVPAASEDNGRPEQVRALVSDLGGPLLAVGDDLGRITEVEEAVATAFVWTAGLVIVLAIAGGALLSRAFLRRVDAIARTAEAIIGGDLARRVPLQATGDDLDRLAGTLNRMLDRIGTLMDSLRQVSTDVAHDLRTPLSRLYQRLDGVRGRACSAAECQVAIDGAVQEAEDLLQTFSALLRIAQVEGSPHGGFRAVDLTAVADAVVDAYRPDAEDHGRQLAAELAPGVFVSGDQELLTQALVNLVENALRHTPAGTRIVVRLGPDGGGVRLVVEDDGPGVGAVDLPRLTGRFYRAEHSRTTPGNGLGLSLVAAVAELHGAELRLDDCAPGLRVTLRLSTLVGPLKARAPRPEGTGSQLNKEAGI